MGTRNLTAVFLNGEYKVAQYCQWDGYPSGQGKTILEFLHQPGNIDKLRESVKQCTWIDEKELEDFWVECGAERGSESVSIAVGGELKKKYPQFSRDTGAKILDLIVGYTTAFKSGVKLRNNIGFVFDSLFCEWAYVIDFDKNVFEVYQGFNKKPLGPRARFHANNIKDTIDIKQINPTQEYYPVKLKKKFKLSALPTEEVFLSKFKS